jgi:hypothetical protein
MNLQVIKYYVIVLVSVACVILSMSALKEIEIAQNKLDEGKKIAYYLRSSTDSLTYYAIAYTSTKDSSFLDTFNKHLQRRKQKVFSLDQEAQVFYNKGLEISNQLAKNIEEPAFDSLNSTAFFSKEYLGYKTNIYTNIEELRNSITDKAKKKLEIESNLLSIYIYLLCLTIMYLIVEVRNNNEKQIKKTIKRKKK